MLRTNLSDAQVIPAEDLPFSNPSPVILSTPSPVFTEGIPAAYDMSQHFSDEGPTTVLTSLTEELAAGLSYSDHVLIYDGSAASSTIGTNTFPFPQSQVITGVSFSGSKTRLASGSDNWPVTWGDDDKIYTAFGDGWGFDPPLSSKAALGTAVVSGSSSNISGVNLATISSVNGSSHKPTGILMVGGVLYLWTRRDDGRLWKSTDHAQTWQNTGVTMEQGDENFHSLNFCQFGANYADARDSYVYVYATGSSAIAGDIFLFRVPSTLIEDTGSYEYYTGLDGQGDPTWSSNIANKAAIVSHSGRARDSRVVYIPGLGRYLLTYSWYDGSDNGDIAILDAAEPWGPWTTVFYSDNWEGQFTFEYNFPQKWISADGKSLTMVYSGTSNNDAFVARDVEFTTSALPTPSNVLEVDDQFNEVIRSDPFAIQIIAIETGLPLWNSTFVNLPDAVTGEAYSQNLKDFGVGIDEVREIASSRDPTDSIWPDGLSLNTTTGILSGTPTTEDEVAVVTCIGVSGTFDAAADWAYRSTLSSVKILEDFPDNASVRDISDNLSGEPDRSIWDSSIKLYGAGSLRQEILDTTQYTASANWKKQIIGGTYRDSIPPGPTKMAVGDEVWITFSNRFNRTEPAWEFTDGGTPIHGLKIIIVDKNFTASSYEVVNQTRFGIYRGYTGNTTSVHWEDGRATACSGSDFVYQPEIDRGASPLTGFDPGLPSGNGAGSAWTACQQDRARYGGLFDYGANTNQGRPDGNPDPLTGGMFQPFDWWISYQIHIKRLASTSTLVEWWAAPLGQDWTLMYSETAARGGEYGVIWFTNSHTDMDAEPGVRPLCQRWYDGLITRTGTVGIPAPGFTE